MKKIKYLIFGLVVFLTFSTNANAASATITANDVTLGTSVKVSAKIFSDDPIFFIEGSLTCSGAGVNEKIDLKFETMENNKKSNPYSLTIKPTKIEKIQCKINGKVIDAGSSDWVNVSYSKTINVVKPREKSTNNNLKSLSVEGYTLSPSFNKNTLEYTVNLESNIEKIKINASKEDGYASISGTGEKQVQEGDNKFEITVTSETGNSKVYTVNAVVKDSNPIVKEIDGKSYTVVKRSSALTKPELFESTTVSINDTEIPAFYNETTNITLIGLKDENGSIYLYKYDTKTDSLIKYESLTSSSKTIIFEDTNEVINDYTKTTVTINNIEYNAYQHQSNKNYVLIYGMDIKTGEKNWYLYNIKENSIQTYISDIINTMTDDFNKTLKEYKMVLLGMASLSLILLLIIIIQFISKNKLKNKLLKKLKIEKENSELKKEDSNSEKQEKLEPKKKKNKNK